MAITLRDATPADAAVLSDLALRSKRFWGYSQEFLERCRSELTVTESRMVDERITVAELSGEVAGFSSISVDPPSSELNDLFVEPQAIGAGIGTMLWEAACERVLAAGAEWMDIVADPNAADWYERRGAQRSGTAPSESIPGRELPTLRIVFRTGDPHLVPL